MFSQVFVNCVSLLALAALSFIPVTNRDKVPALVQSSVSTAFVPTTMLPAAGFDAPRGGSRSQAALRAKVAKNYGELPLSFQPNRGQTNSKARFLSQNAQYTLFLTDDEAIFSFADQLASTPGKVGLRPISRELRSTVPLRPGTVLRMKLRRANPAAKVSGEGKLSSKSNYFIGNDPKKWMQGVTNYAKVKYKDVYSGIDLVYYGNQRQLEYDFVVAPGASASQIALGIGGATAVGRDTDGALVLTTPQGDVRWKKPVAYQERAGRKDAVAVDYKISRGNEVQFALGPYDRSRALVIDPVLVYSFLAGTTSDVGYSVAVDNFGNAYVAGEAYEDNQTTPYTSTFPTTPGSFEPTYPGTFTAAFVTKFDPSGSAIYSTFVGGTTGLGSYARAIAVDSEGNAYITGNPGNGSTDFPLVNPFESTSGSFVTKLNPTGSALVYSTLFPADTTGITVDSAGDTYITGSVGSGLPVMNALESSPFIYQSAFVTKFDPTGSALLYSTYLGGNGGVSAGGGIALDGSGNAYVVGATAAQDFPLVNPLDSTLLSGGSFNLESPFVSEINPSGSAFVYSTYLPQTGLAPGNFQANSVAVDASGNAYVLGGGDINATLVWKINAMGSALAYATQVSLPYGFGIAVDTSGDAWVAGETGNGGSGSAIALQIDPAGATLSTTNFGTGEANAIAVDGFGDVYVTGLIYPSVPNSAASPQINGVTGGIAANSTHTRAHIVRYASTGAAPAASSTSQFFASKITTADVTITGSPQQPLTTDGSGNFVAQVTITNTSNVPVSSIQVTTATLGSGSLLSAPAAITNLAAGASAVVTLTFPASAVPAGATTAPLKVEGTYSIPAVPLDGNWSLSFRRVTL